MTVEVRQQRSPFRLLDLRAVLESRSHGVEAHPTSDEAVAACPQGDGKVLALFELGEEHTQFKAGTIDRTTLYCFR